MNEPLLDKHPLKPLFDNIPDELKALRQWVNWKAETRRGKETKPPYTPERNYAKSDDPLTWSTFDAVRKAVDRFDGIGFVLTKDDPYVGIDFDKCYDPAFNLIDPIVERAVKTFKTYTEISPSGKGLRLLLKGVLPVRGRKNGNREVYSSRRYVTLTGHILDGFPGQIEHRQEALDQFYRAYFPAKNTEEEKPQERPSQTFDLRDRLQKAFNSRSGAEIKRLYDGDWSPAYSSQSEADLALCAHLAFWLSGDPAAMDHAFRESKLCRKKWDEIHFSDGRTYGEETISKAISGCNEFYQESTKTEYEKEEEPDREGNLILKALSRNEDGDAELFIDLFRNRFLYDHASGRWYVWGEHYWVEDLTDDVTASVKDVAAVYESEYMRQSELAVKAMRRGGNDHFKKHDAIRKDLINRIKQLQAINRKRDVVCLAKTGAGTLGISGKEWNSNPMLLGCKNGIINLVTGDIRPGKPDDYIKTITNVGYYDLNRPCPHWDDFLLSTFNGNQELITYLQKRCGYSLTGRTNEHDIAILEGPGRNGKTTFVEAMSHVLGKLAGQCEVESLLTQFKARQAGSPTSDLMALREKRFVYAVESDQGRSLNASRIKWLTGGDTLTGREVYGKQQVSFTPSFKIWFVTNHLPHIDSDDYAIWSRIRRIPFRFAFVPDPKEKHERKSDPYILEKLKEEASGILSWMIRGCLLWQAEGLRPPSIIKDATDNYRNEEDVIRRFLHDTCTLDKNNSVQSQSLYHAYKQWCGNNGHSPFSITRFGKNMKRNYDCYEERHITYYRGIKLIKYIP